jgi:hypothetical protein
MAVSGWQTDPPHDVLFHEVRKERGSYLPNVLTGLALDGGTAMGGSRGYRCSLW